MSFYLVQFLTGLASASSLFLVAAGLTLIFGVTRIVNLAHGSFYMLGAYVAYTLIQALGGGVFAFVVGIAGGTLAAGLVGVAMETTLLRRIYRAPELFQLIATYGVVLVVKDATRMIWGVADRTSPSLPGSVSIGGSPLPVYDIVFIAIGPAVLGLMWLLMRRTRFGVLVRAATQDRDMVGALGVNQKRLFTGVFFVGALLAGLGGALQMLRPESVNLQMDLLIIAPAFVVVVVGGMGSLAGAYLAAFLIAELNAFGILVLPKITLVMMFLIMAVVLVVRPWGLLGRPESPAHGAGAEAPLRPAERRLTLLYLGVLAALLAVPLAGAGAAVTGIEILIFVLWAASLHFILGPGGLHSFGHAAYFGLGAYAVGMLTQYAPELGRWGADALATLGLAAAPAALAAGLKTMELGIALAPVAAAIGALVVGWLAGRLAGVYFAMLTLACAQLAWSYVFQSDATHGENGLLGLRRGAWVEDKRLFYFLVLALVVGGVLLLRRFLYAPFGYTLRAGRDSPRRAEAVGIDVRRHQWLAFTLAGAFAGLAGGLYAYSKGNVLPNVMDIGQSFEVLFMVLLGGVQTLAGPLVGATAFTLLNDSISAFTYRNMVLGVAILLIVLAFPQGIAGFLRDRVGPALGFVRREELIGGGRA
jgi:branched-chain amino acid transport system permease protein